jgi:pimeloyl-ACP methyl ester carboxylesterase
VDTLLSREDITDRLGEITCPALVIHGNADAAIPVAKAAELASGLPGAWPLVVVEGAGHAANLSHPDEVNAEIRRFLDAL